MTEGPLHTNLLLSFRSYDMVGGQPSSMAIIELTPFSGYNAVKPSLEAILSRNQIKRFDADGSPIILYFDEVIYFSNMAFAL